MDYRDVSVNAKGGQSLDAVGEDALMVGVSADC
jgi:hypothetical protein